MATALINPTNHTARTEIHINARVGTPATIPADRPPDPRAELRQAHLDAAAVVAELDLDDRRLWHRVDRATAELAGAAYDLAAALTGTPAGSVASFVPPVVRVRELASAQRRLFHALDRHPEADRELVAWGAAQAHRLLERLRRNAVPWPGGPSH